MSDPRRRTSSPSGRPRCAWRAARATRWAHPARALGLDGGHHGISRRVVVAEAHEDLVEDDAVEDLDAVLRAEDLGEAPRARAAALDQVGHALRRRRGRRLPSGELCWAPFDPIPDRRRQNSLILVDI
jgi:hypothetical protein